MTFAKVSSVLYTEPSINQLQTFCDAHGEKQPFRIYVENGDICIKSRFANWFRAAWISWSEGRMHCNC